MTVLDADTPGSCMVTPTEKDGEGMLIVHLNLPDASKVDFTIPKWYARALATTLTRAAGEKENQQ